MKKLSKALRKRYDVELSDVVLPSGPLKHLAGSVGFSNASVGASDLVGLVFAIGVVMAPLAGLLYVAGLSPALLVCAGFLMASSWTAGTVLWIRTLRNRVVVTPEIRQVFGDLVKLAVEVEACEPSEARDDLLAAIAVSARGLVEVGVELKAAGESNVTEVAAHHDAAECVLVELKAAHKDLLTAQVKRREAFTVQSDLSNAGVVMAAVQAATSAARTSTSEARDVETAVVEELLEIRDRHTPTKPPTLA